jgi:hypothetical protein
VERAIIQTIIIQNKYGRNETLLLLWGGLIWDNSTDRMDDENAVVDFYHCPKCGYSYEVYSPTEEEKVDYKDYWNGK